MKITISFNPCLKFPQCFFRFLLGIYVRRCFSSNKKLETFHATFSTDDFDANQKSMYVLWKSSDLGFLGFTSRKINSSPPENTGFLKRIKICLPIPSRLSGAFTCWLRLRPRKMKFGIPEKTDVLERIFHPGSPKMQGWAYFTFNWVFILWKGMLMAPGTKEGQEFPKTCRARYKKTPVKKGRRHNSQHRGGSICNTLSCQLLAQIATQRWLNLQHIGDCVPTHSFMLLAVGGGLVEDSVLTRSLVCGWGEGSGCFYSFGEPMDLRNAFSTPWWPMNPGYLHVALRFETSRCDLREYGRVVTWDRNALWNEPLP